MRRLLFFFALALYGSTAMDLHEWVRVPQVFVHLLEHHSDFGHHHDDAAEHGHDDEEDGHNPFGHAQHEACGASSLASLPCDPCSLSLIVPSGADAPVAVELAAALSAYSGSKWNPPKLV